MFHLRSLLEKIPESAEERAVLPIRRGRSPLLPSQPNYGARNSLVPSSTAISCRVKRSRIKQKQTLLN
ncbi:MAG: hypothetical protein QNJ54_37975 [Prochloraceae cyanobacterium]|nr:hypothetical protein [Prochloraceae cyanobacterium]